MRLKDPLWSLNLLRLLSQVTIVIGLEGHVDQAQTNTHIIGENIDFSDEIVERVKRSADSDKDNDELKANLTHSSVFHLNNSHLHLMVHWAGKGSSIVFCLARDQVCRDEN